MGLTLTLVQQPPVFRPGNEVVGTVAWTGLAGRQKVVTNLLWYTTGKGTRDVGIVAKVVVERPARDGERAFVFKLPAAPYSFSGKLITLTWAVEASVTPGNETAKVDLVMSPTGAELRLGHAASRPPAASATP
jgi:hypothetical protein